MKVTAHHLTRLKERYIIHEVMGRGERGTVYRAFDLLGKHDVALKAVDDGADDPLAQLLAVRSVVISLADPALVKIEDIGEIEEGGAHKLFFTTPLLPGVSLERLIREAPARLTIKAVIRIVSQVSRSLHAAHEQGIAHGSLRASSIFAFDDKGVKILDFGMPGRVEFLAPEQAQSGEATPLADQYALGALAYHAFTLKSPTGSDGGALAPVFECNEKAGMAISQVVRRAMAKRPERRFADLVEFSDALRKAARSPAVEPAIDWARIRHRMQRAELCFKEGDVALAAQILEEIESEGYLDEEIHNLRKRIDEARLKIEQRAAIGNAREFFELSEYPKALEKAQEAIELNPADGEALALKNHIEKESRLHQIEEWMAQARQHLEHGSPKQAREVLGHVLEATPEDEAAQRVATEIEAYEQEQERATAEKARLYEAAVRAWEHGEIGAAEGHMNLLMAMEGSLPDAKRNAAYHVFDLRVQAEQEAVRKAHEVARADLAGGDIDAASAICAQALEKYPGHPQFLELKTAIEHRRREGLAAIIAVTERNAEVEPDLDRRVKILEEAAARHPDEVHFQNSLRRAREKRDLVATLIAKARVLEEKSQFADALDRWQIVGSMHERQPGLASEIGRLIKRRDKQARRIAKSRWIEEAQLYYDSGDDFRAKQAIETGLLEFPAEPQLLELDQKLRRRSAPGPRLLAPPQAAPAQSPIDSGKQDFVGWCVRQARRLQASGDWAGALAVVGQGLLASPGDLGLLSLQAELQRGRAVEPVAPPQPMMLQRLPPKHYPVITPAPPLLRDSVDSGQIALRTLKRQRSFWRSMVKLFRN